MDNDPAVVISGRLANLWNSESAIHIYLVLVKRSIHTRKLFIVVHGQKQIQRRIGDESVGVSVEEGCSIRCLRERQGVRRIECHV
ncbi:hypothetical protein M3J09_011664 [Ascochyta lentis]